jgi:hypothetical protein
MSNLARSFALVGALAVGLAAADAHAYCRARTCDPTQSACALEDDCIVTGKELYWPSDCVTFAVQEDGSKEHGIDAEAVAEAAEDAFDRWSRAECPGGGSPSIEGEYVGTVECSKSEFSTSAANANIIMLRDDWPYATGEGVLGLTLVRFGTKTGRLDDADIEINGEEFELDLAPSGSEADLDVILTHEIGHLLGLNHSSDETATMFASYVPRGSEALSLSEDDVAGICDAYPPDREIEEQSCSPLNGFSGDCIANQKPVAPPLSSEGGCSVAPGNRGLTNLAFCLLAFAGALAFARRRDRERPA